jgi:hypothetical protein
MASLKADGKKYNIDITGIKNLRDLKNLMS